MVPAYKQISQNPATVTVSNFHAATNALAEQQIKRGNQVDFLSAKNAPEVYAKMLKLVVSLANPASKKHNEVYNALTDLAGRNSKSIDYLSNIGKSVFNNVQNITKRAMESGHGSEGAVDVAFNALGGNPVYDHFANLGLLAHQLFEEQTFIETFIEKGDAFAVPLEKMNTGTMKSRFRVPVEKLTGSPNIASGDIYPRSGQVHNQNPMGLELINEFKDAYTFQESLRITRDMENDVLDFEIAANPALAGFILQSRFFETYQQFILKLAETYFIEGLDGGSYAAATGGGYGLLSPAIILALADAGSESPVPASSANWVANPTKLIQQITNYYYEPSDITAPLDGGSDINSVYKDLLRLMNLAAIANVNMSSDWILYVPTSWFGMANQFASTSVSGATTVNVVTKTLQELINQLNDGSGSVIKNVTVKPSSQLNAGFDSRGNATLNRFVFMSTGAEMNKKPVILPGQTTIPTMVAGNVNANESEFLANYVTGGPMFLQYGGAFVLSYSTQAA